MPRLSSASAGLALVCLAAAVPAQAFTLRGSLENQVQSRIVNNRSAFNPDNRNLDLSPGNDSLTLRLAATDDLVHSDAGLRVSYYVKPYGCYEAKPTPSGTVTTTDHSQFRLDEGYADCEWGEHLYLLAGKKRVSWGVGFFANPVDAINPLKNVRDPQHSEEGTPVLLAELGYGEVAVTGLVTRDVDADFATRNTRGGGAVNLLLAGVETKLYGFGGDQVKSLAGLTVRDNFGDWVVYAEAARRWGSDRWYADSQGAVFTKDEGQWSGLAGASYSLAATVSLTGEYFYDQRGYTSSERRNYLEALGRPSPRRGLLLSQAGRSLSQHYAAVSFSGQQLREVWDLGVRAIASLDGWSAWVNASAAYHLSDTMTAQLEQQGAFGDSNTEYGNALFQAQTNLYLTLYF